MTNKARQPKTGTAVGDPNKGKSAGTITKVGGKGNTLDSTPDTDSTNRVQ